MERKMKFSVIVPVYNCEDSLPRCIESILYQTYPDWELLLIDDGSTDGSFSLCEAYAKQDGRIRVIHQENAGQGPARNNGMKEATGDYVVFCDADDFYEKDALEIFALSAGTGTERLTDMIVGGYRDFCYTEDGEIRIRNENQAYTAKCHSDGETHAEFMHLKRMNLIDAPWAKAYRRKLLLEKCIFFPDMRRQQDIFFNIDFYDAICTLKVIKSVLYNYFLPVKDEQLKKFPRDMFGIIKTNYLKLCGRLELWHQLDQESLQYLNRKFIKDISVLLRLNYRNLWKLSKKERRELSIKMLHDETTVAACRTVPDGSMDQLIRLVVMSRSVALANLFSAGTILYQKIRGE